MFRQAVFLGFLALVTIAQTQTTCQLDSIPTATPVPQLNLPWGVWNATCFQSDNQIYLFKNVRFGTVPERFGPPIRPNWLDDTVQNMDWNVSCIQVDRSEQPNPPGGTPLIGDPSSNAELQCEDCLFLDIYVPVSAFQPESELLPVVVWFYGGAYAIGSKTPIGPIYTGQSSLNASNYQTIFIVGNYRLGAFGWLAGDYMQKAGQPNAGLYDQALLLEWVRDYVHLIQGDKDRVSAWGESAGAGSILHHLIREDGKQDPLFNTFATQSPAFQWAWDNSPDGQLDTIYRNFSDLSGCGYGYNISCLRNASVETLALANQELFKQVTLEGLFPVGPAVDGNWIKSIPAVSFSQGNYWRGIEAAIISHTANEPQSFTPNISTQDEFDEFLNDFLPGPNMEIYRIAISKQYNCTADFDGDFHRCLSIIIRDSTFTCNTRNLFEAYPNSSYMMQYAFPWDDLAVHASDLIPLFTNNRQQVAAIIESITGSTENGSAYSELLGDKIPSMYKNYFASLSLYGNPNVGPSQPEVSWPVANGSADKLSDVMRVSWDLFGHNFQLITDDQNANSTCSFWTELAKNLTSPQGDIDSEGRVPLTKELAEL
ncbi:hypothetical protein O1611_g2365 [Lasiodiplodia mahajangana]|uniref:Uncharacterized protein n=1 Tax=Lasiodiplodia mahajangana TaxID=1108764 RepID=A0ACC2JUV4_9PEZI|nr:hypothetical protein O1611_g2365 [Lasiodiplodia mahajangana]